MPLLLGTVRTGRFDIEQISKKLLPCTLVFQRELRNPLLQIVFGFTPRTAAS